MQRKEIPTINNAKKFPGKKQRRDSKNTRNSNNKGQIKNTKRKNFNNKRNVQIH